MTDSTSRHPIVVRGPVKPVSQYGEYKQQLRIDFWFSCAYCSITEIEASAVGFEIDHYYPVKARLDLKKEYDNLMWSCRHCNRRKGAWCPTADQERDGKVILRTDQQHPADHIEPRGLRVGGKTVTGDVTVQVLDLNRHTLQKLRSIRSRLWKSADYLAYGVHELLNLSIDRFHPQRRAVFLKIRKSVVEKCEVLDGRLDEEIRSFAGSPYLDESDDSAYDRTRDRRDYLKSQNALAPAVGPRSARKKSGPRS